eukprot:PhM_4_TR10803/c0_g1_i1/m.52610/K14855/RSA4, NLE1; ribosome assembly protein 4
MTSKRTRDDEDVELKSAKKPEVTHVMVQLVDEEGNPTGAQISTPVETKPDNLDVLLNSILNQSEDDYTPYAYYVDSEQMNVAIGDLLLKKQKEAWLAKMEKEGRRIRKFDVETLKLEVPAEHVVQIVYRPQAVFKVLPVTRCTAAMTGHSEAVLALSFSPDGSVLASGSGDKTVRLWDVITETPIEVLQGHPSWVQVLGWSPTGEHLASGSVDGILYVWKGAKGKRLTGHKLYITAVSWEPLHMNIKANRFVSSSKDGTVRMWDVSTARPEVKTLSGHTSCVTCVKWGGQGAVYSSSEDRTLIVWNADEGSQRHVLRGHAHWVNRFTLNTELVIRSGAYDHTKQTFETPEAAQAYAKKRYDDVIALSNGEERLVSCSDDTTLFMWAPCVSSKPITRMHGHQDLVFNVMFSPDGTTIASCSQDKSIKLWRARDGKYIESLRNHVGSVYHVTWALDSRLLISASKDTTVKLWEVSTGRMICDLPGHADEVYAADWSPDGLRAASGSKDKSIRVWKH